MINFDDVLAAARRAPSADARLPYDGRPLSFGDLRLPSKRDEKHSEKHPIVVLIHGGCWKSEYDVAHIAAAAHAMTREGFAVWAPEYRRLGNAGGGWPGTFDDVAAATDFVRELAKTHPIDLRRVVLAGHSAGAQLALWAASRHREDPNALRPAGVLSLAGITNLAQYGAAEGECNASVTPLLGGTPEEVGERYAAVSPVERLPIGVRSILVHGAHDRIVPPGTARSFADRARKAGDDATFTMVMDAGHFDVIMPKTPAWEVVVTSLTSLVSRT